MINCPACQAANHKSTSTILFCPSCGHRWLNRAQDEHEISEKAIFTDEYVGYRFDAKYVDAIRKIAARELVSRVSPPARVLDLGCGAGDFMIALQSLGYEVEGIDISTASAEICRRRGLHVRAANFLSCDFSSRFDLICMWDVVAHLRNPAEFLDRARSLLTARGLIFIKTPGFGDLSVRLSSRWPRIAGVLLGAPSHIQYFDRESLTALLSRSALRAEWINAGQARSQGTGGSLKRRLSRRLRKTVSRLSGDSNIYVVAQPIR